MVAQGRRADARLLSRGRCAWSSLLDIPPWALQQRSSESPLVYAWGVRMNNQCAAPSSRSEEHTSELQSLMRISYAVFCLKKKNKRTNTHNQTLNNHIT